MGVVKENQYGTAERQNVLLEMMKEVHAFCERNGVRYSLCGGTLLGAIRHEGFIPWDDDIDVMLDRENYNKFLACAEDLQDYELKRELWTVRVRKIGVTDPFATIDLFVLDNVPENKCKAKWKVFRLKILQGMMKKERHYEKFSFGYKGCLFATNLLGKLFTYNYKWNRYHRISQIGNKKKTGGVAIYNDLFKYLNYVYTPNLMEKIKLQKFEDAEFYITEEYDNYLKRYGDYMTPPKEEERIPIHMQ